MFLQPKLLDGKGFIKFDGEDYAIEEIRPRILEAAYEWHQVIEFVARLQSGMITLSMSDYAALPAYVLQAWDLFVLEVQELKGKK